MQVLAGLVNLVSMQVFAGLRGGHKLCAQLTGCHDGDVAEWWGRVSFSEHAVILAKA